MSALNDGLRVAVGVGMLLSLTPASASDALFIHDQATITHDFYGCPNRADIDKIVSLVGEHDGVAINRAATRGGCREFPIGTTGSVEDSSFWGRTCLRPKGDPDCFWTPTQFLVKVPPAAPVPEAAASAPKFEAPAADDAEGPKAPPISDADEKAMIAKVKSTWKAEDGESVIEIENKLSRVAHFVPREWGTAQTEDGSNKSVVMSWARHPADKEDAEYSIPWEFYQDGSFTLGTPGKLLVLGWQAFAIATISEEIDVDPDSVSAPSRAFLHNLTNLNFVNTPQGRLGDLLARGRCALGDPVGLDYMDKWGRDKPETGDFYRLQLSVNCAAAGPRYFTHDGIILFMKHGTGIWRPYSFFAKRIFKYPPGRWFASPDLDEQIMFRAVAAAGAKADHSSDDIANVAKVLELRNDSAVVPW